MLFKYGKLSSLQICLSPSHIVVSEATSESSSLCPTLQKVRYRVMTSSHSLSIVKCVLVSIGTCTNLYTNRWIKQTFDIKQSLYRVLWLDSLTTTVSTFASLIEVVGLLTDLQYGPFGCFVIAYLSHAGFYTNPLLTFMISYIRLVYN